MHNWYIYLGVQHLNSLLDKPNVRVLPNVYSIHRPNVRISTCPRSCVSAPVKYLTNPKNPQGQPRISWILYTSWTSWVCILYTAASWKTTSCVIAPRFQSRIFGLNKYSEAASGKLITPIFSLRQAALFGSQSEAPQGCASRFSVIVENRESAPRNPKNFFKKFFSNT